VRQITPVIMAGGSGTRLWPLSRKGRPKQFQPLVTERSMLSETVQRVRTDAFGPPVVIGSAHHLPLIEEALPPGGQVVLEPVGRNTAPAAIVAALLATKTHPEALVLLLPADHHIEDPSGFRAAVARGAEAAEQGRLVTLGIEAREPETGYGYIKQGEAVAPGVFAVERFVEKPDRATAQSYLQEGGYSWNAGIFLFRASDLLEEAKAHAPDLLGTTRQAFDAAEREAHLLLLPEKEFAAVAGDSIDYAIMEKTRRAAVVSPVAIGWNDIGSWAAARGYAQQTVAPGSVAIGCQDLFIRTEEGAPMVAAVGVEGLTIVATRDAVLILPTDRSQDVKSVVEALKAEGREDLL
jgi:mannose-1-phosphate guanylyltransferase/mannose-6-phosphate isomerase